MMQSHSSPIDLTSDVCTNFRISISNFYFSRIKRQIEHMPLPPTPFLYGIWDMYTIRHMVGDIPPIHESTGAGSD